MAVIVFITDIEEGHVLPTFALAHELQNAGHHVHYIGIPDIRQGIEKNGFTFHTIFDQIYPAGFVEYYRTLQQEQSHLFTTNESSFPRPHLEAILEGSLDALFTTLKPDLLMVSFFFAFETILIQKNYPDVALAFFTPWLRRPSHSPSTSTKTIFQQLPAHDRERILAFLELEFIDEAADRLNAIPELIPCPRELEQPDVSYDTTVYHIGPSIRSGIAGETDELFPESKKIIYASLGSQTTMFLKTSKVFFDNMLRTMRQECASDWHLIMSIGNSFSTNDFGEIPGNVSLFTWAPQMDVLSNASIAITHGGLGTIKECIFHGVPMIVLPIIRDSAENAERVEHHRLGIKEDIEDLSVERITGNIQMLLVDREINDSVRSMQKLFQDKQHERCGLKLVEKILEGQAN